MSVPSRQRAVRSHRKAAAALVPALLLVLVGVAAAPSSTSSGVVVVAAGLGLSGSIPLPPALETSWSARSGYVPGLLQVVSAPHLVTGQLTVVVSLWPADLSLFSHRSPAARGLSPAQFESRFSPSPASYQALAGYFVSHGLTILHTWSDRLALTVSGPAEQVAAAFGTSVYAGSWSGREVSFPTTIPSLPPPFSAEVLAVSGLSSGFTQFSLPHAPAAATGPPHAGSLRTFGTTGFVTPSDLHGAYNLDALYNLSGRFHSAAGQGIVLLLWGYGYVPSDISTFFAQHYPSQFPQPTWIPHPIDGAPSPSSSATSDPSTAPEELTLDLEWAGSTAPGATLHAVYAPDGPASSNYSPTDITMEDALSTAVNQISGVTVISMSFGLPEGGDPPFEAAYSTYFAEAQSRNITVLAASGDDGGAQIKSNQCTTTAEVQFPASSPLVVAVGGTNPTLQTSITGQVTGLASESAWNRSGGGFSNDYSPAPSWQKVGSAATVIGSHGRAVPDVAGPAANNYFYYSGTGMAGQGTSFATPFWGGLVAELNAIRGAPFGFFTPRLYAIGAAEASGASAQALSDITSGGTCLWTAQVGYDLTTGWGSPRGLELYGALTSTFVTLAVGVAPNSVAPGGSTTVTVTVENATSHQRIANVPVNLSLAASGYSGPCGGSFAQASPVTDANGTARASLGVPACYPGSSALVTATVLARGYFGQGSASLGVNLLSGTGLLALLETFPYNVIVFALIIALAIGIGLGLSRRGRRRRGQWPPGTGVPPGASGGPPATPPWLRTAAPYPPPAPPYGNVPPPPPSATLRDVPPAPGGPLLRASGAADPASSASPNISPPIRIPRTPAATVAPPGLTGIGRSVRTAQCLRCGSSIPEFSLYCPRCGTARP